MQFTNSWSEDTSLNWLFILGSFLKQFLSDVQQLKDKLILP